MAKHCGVRGISRMRARTYMPYMFEKVIPVVVCAECVCVCNSHSHIFVLCTAIWFDLVLSRFSSVQFRWALRSIFCIFHCILFFSLFAPSFHFSWIIIFFAFLSLSLCVCAHFIYVAVAFWLLFTCSLQNAQFQLCHPFLWWRKNERIPA